MALALEKEPKEWAVTSLATCLTVVATVSISNGVKNPEKGSLRKTRAKAHPPCSY